jgi:hypothetical protein
MDQAILRALAAEVQSRKCPGCGNSLRQADISAHFAGTDKVQLHFRCRFCVFEGGGEIELTPEIYREAAETTIPEQHEHESLDPISADEVLQVHELLQGWRHGLQELVGLRQAEPPPALPS